MARLTEAMKAMIGSHRHQDRGDLDLAVPVSVISHIILYGRRFLGKAVARGAGWRS
ncbi:MAG: hypothetical protein ACYC9Q_07530 [Bacillota bacterium]